jgi:hypothetical protein
MRYRWEFYPNRAMAALHVDAAVPRFGISLDKSEAGESLRGALEALPGVEEAYSSHKYQVTITRGMAFDWDEIRMPVLRVVAEHLGQPIDEANRLTDIPARHETPAEALDHGC